MKSMTFGGQGFTVTTKTETHRLAHQFETEAGTGFFLFLRMRFGGHQDTRDSANSVRAVCDHLHICTQFYSKSNNKGVGVRYKLFASVEISEVGKPTLQLPFVFR